MAYTILQAPIDASVFSFNSPLWHVVNSSNYAQPDFRYVLKIYVAGSVTPVTLKIVPDVAGNGYIDVSRVVRAGVVNYFAPVGVGAAPFTMNTDDIEISYFVDYGEEYLGAYFPTLTSATYLVFNSYATDTPGALAYTPSFPYKGAWLTDRDIANIRISEDGNAFISYFNYVEQPLKLFVQNLDDDDGTPGIITRVTSLMSSLKKLLVINLDPAYISASPYTPAFDFSVGPGYMLTLLDSADVPVSETLIVRWMCQPKVDATPLHFLNKHGGFDTYYFTGPTRRTGEFERSTYERLGATNNAGLIKEFSALNVYADTVVPYTTKHEWTRKLSSGYLTDAESDWLSQLVASPQVYLEQDGYYYPVTIQTMRWEQKLNRFDKLYNLDLEIKMGRSIYSQFR